MGGILGPGGCVVLWDMWASGTELYAVDGGGGGGSDEFVAGAKLLPKGPRGGAPVEFGGRVGGGAMLYCQAGACCCCGFG